MSPKRILEHILLLNHRYGIREISFYDDTFTTDQERIEALCRMILNQRIKISWSCFARVDTVTPQLLLLMKKAGCHQIMYGFESIDEKILKTSTREPIQPNFRKLLTGPKRQKSISVGLLCWAIQEKHRTAWKELLLSPKFRNSICCFQYYHPISGNCSVSGLFTERFAFTQKWDLYNLDTNSKTGTVSAQDI